MEVVPPLTVNFFNGTSGKKLENFAEKITNKFIQGIEGQIKQMDDEAERQKAEILAAIKAHENKLKAEAKAKEAARIKEIARQAAEAVKKAKALAEQKKAELAAKQTKEAPKAKAKPKAKDKLKLKKRNARSKKQPPKRAK